MPTLERAIAIAVEAHKGQLRKDGEPYILHPLRVMSNVGLLVNAKIAAVLHDVVEDSAWTLDQLREEGFSEEVVHAVDALTHREGEEYMAYVARGGGESARPSREACRSRRQHGHPSPTRSARQGHRTDPQVSRRTKLDS